MFPVGKSLFVIEGKYVLGNNVRFNQIKNLSLKVLPWHVIKQIMEQNGR